MYADIYNFNKLFVSKAPCFKILVALLMVAENTLAERVRLLRKGLYAWYDTKQRLEVMHQFSNSEKCGFTKSFALLPGPLWPGVWYYDILEKEFELL